ncbi:MAG: hypothetical protein HQL45_17005 [Alphaproteobacteria bacterium]|nr:hypothetical protein [Alphaproteobacteria bacterium]
MNAHLKSKTVWGLALAAAITLCQLLGFDSGGAYLAQLALMQGIEINPAQIERFTQLGALGLAYYGRSTATAPLGNLLTFLFKSSAKAGKPFAGLALAMALLGSTLSACAFVGVKADKYLGACSEAAVILARDTQFTDMLAKYYGESTVDDLREALAVLDQTVQAKKPIEAAQDAYRLRFVSFVIHRGVVTGIKIVAGNFDIVVDKMSALPDFRADIAAIKARTILACPEAAP